MKKIIVIIIICALVILAGSLIYFRFYKYSKTFSKKDIEIGLIADLTGPMALYGQWVLNGAEIAISEVNDNHSIPKMHLIIEDSQSDPKSAVNAIRKLINVNKIRIIISGNGSSSVMAMAPIANKQKTILFVTLASSPSITDAGDYIFRNRISGLSEIQEMAKFMAKKFNIKDVAVSVLDNEAGNAYIKTFIDVFNKFEGNVVLSVLLEPDETDFRAQAAKIREAKPEAVFYAGSVKEGAYLIKQTKEIGIQIKWYSVSPIQSEELFNIAEDAANGLIFAVEGVDENNQIYLEFKEKYKQKYGEVPSIYAINGYDAIKLMHNLIVKVGNNADEIKTALYNLKDYKGAGGNLNFDNNGDVIKPIILRIVKNKEFKNYNLN